MTLDAEAKKLFENSIMLHINLKLYENKHITEEMYLKAIEIILSS